MVFRRESFYSTTPAAFSTPSGISAGLSYRTVPSRVRQFARKGKHSNHRHLRDPGPIGSTIHRWTAFAERHRSYGCSQSLSWGFIHWPLQPVHAHQGQAFPGVTPSFHLSNDQFTSDILVSHVRQLFTADEQVALSQKGSLLLFPSGVVFLISAVIIVRTPLSSRI